MMPDKTRRVAAIKNGTVIDHIPGGSVLQVLKLLDLDGSRGTPISLVMNVSSNKLVSKDIAKVEDRELTQMELDKLSLIAPQATVAIIRDYRVVEKREITLVEEMEDVVGCSFENCISLADREPLPQRMKVVAKNPLKLRCHYCNRDQPSDALVDNIL